MFKRTEEQEWTRFSKALSSKDKEESAEGAAAEPASPAEASGATEEREAAPAQPQVRTQTPPPAPPATARPVQSDVNVSVARMTQPTPRQSAGNGDLHTVVGPQTTFSGTLRSETSVRILGSVEGEIFSQQAVLIEEQASVKAKVSADSVTVAGEIVGEIQCAGRVEILPTGRVHGEIQAGTLIMQEGAFFEGHLKMGPETRVETQAPPTAAPSEAVAARSRR